MWYSRETWTWNSVLFIFVFHPLSAQRVHFYIDIVAFRVSVCREYADEREQASECERKKKGQLEQPKYKYRLIFIFISRKLIFLFSSLGDLICSFVEINRHVLTVWNVRKPKTFMSKMMMTKILIEGVHWIELNWTNSEAHTNLSKQWINKTTKLFNDLPRNSFLVINCLRVFSLSFHFQICPTWK